MLTYNTESPKTWLYFSWGKVKHKIEQFSGLTLRIRESLGWGIHNPRDARLGTVHDYSWYFTVLTLREWTQYLFCLTLLFLHYFWRVDPVRSWQHSFESSLPGCHKGRNLGSAGPFQEEQSCHREESCWELKQRSGKFSLRELASALKRE